MCRRDLALLAALMASLLATPVARAQLPAARLSSVFPAGAKAGSEVEVTLQGTDLDDVQQLLFSHPGLTARPKLAEPGPFDKGPQPVPNRFVVTVAANVPLGLHELRAAGKYGVSNPRAFAIGDLPEVNEVEPNPNAEQATEVTLPAVINGQSNPGADVDFYRFTAQAGERILVAGYARRIDSPLDSVVTLFDANGRQLGSSGDDEGLDSLVDFTAPASGQYLLRVHDAAYQGNPDFTYRLVVGVLPHIDFVFPPAGLAGGTHRFTLFGRNLPGGQPAGLDLDGHPLQKLDVSVAVPAVPIADAAADPSGACYQEPAAAALDVIPFRLASPSGSSNAVLIGATVLPPVTEAEPNQGPAQAQKLTLPCEVMGQFFPARDRDWFQFEARQGESLTVEVISQRMGVRSNPSLLLERVVKAAEGEQPEQTQQLAYVFESDNQNNQEGGPEFDVRHLDPVHRFTAPADGVYRLLIRDAFADVKGDPRRTYRLAVYRGQPDFRLAAVAEESYSSALLRKGGQVGVRVVAFRRDGFDGEIRVTATGLPAGVTCRDAIIGPAGNSAMLVLLAAPGAAPATGLIQVVGKARIGEAEVTRVARFGTALVPTSPRQDPNQVSPSVEARLTRHLALSISAGEAALVSLDAGGGKVWETSRGGQLKIPFTRAGSFTGQINFVPRGLPPNVNAPAANVAANATSGEFQINLTAATPTGTYTFYLDAIAQQADYSRNPEAAAAAAQRQKEVDQIKLQADAEAKAATDAKAAADKVAADTTAAVNAATAAKTAAEQALANATAAANSAAQQAAQAKAAAAAKPEDANLATAAAAAQKAADDAATKMKTEMANLAAAQKALEEAQVKAKAAADAKVLADQKAAEATQRAQSAAQLKTQTDQLATNLANAAKPQKRNVPLVSPAITLKIVPAPIELAELPAAGPLKQGEKLEVPLTISRLFEFNQQVDFSVVLPQGVGGLSIPNVAIPAGQSQGKLAVQAAPNATPGDHALIVRATMTLNGQGLTVERPLRLNIQAVEAK